MPRLVAGMLLLALAGPTAAGTVTFDTAPAGELPPDWTSAITGEGKGRWTIEKDSTAPSAPHVLKQTGRVARPAFPLCLFGEKLKDGRLQVRFQTLAGTNDQAAGLVWRARDAANYYVCRANALENNVVLYKVQDGKRSALDIVGRRGGYGVDVPVTPGQWHTLTVRFASSRFEVSLDGKVLFQVEDSTFAGPGEIGLWTKADSVTAFDDFEFEPLEPDR